MYKADYHMHTALSIDCNVSIESQIEALLRKGLVRLLLQTILSMILYRINGHLL